MIVKKIYSVLVLALFLASCSSGETLQEYFVHHAENPNFISFDVPTSLLNLEKSDLSAEQQEAVSSLKKLNVLAFKKSKTNSKDFESEKENVKQILKSDDFGELMKMNTSFGKATIQVKGDEDNIDEIIIYGDNDEKGFVLVRVLGEDMNPAQFVQVFHALQKSGYNGEGLEALGSIFGK